MLRLVQDVIDDVVVSEGKIEESIFEKVSFVSQNIRVSSPHVDSGATTYVSMFQSYL